MPSKKKSTTKKAVSKKKAETKRKAMFASMSDEGTLWCKNSDGKRSKRVKKC